MADLLSAKMPNQPIEKTNLNKSDSAATAGPSTALRSGRDDKGREVTPGKIGDLVDGAESRTQPAFASIPLRGKLQDDHRRS
jgi:hypothetical protein